MALDYNPGVPASPTPNYTAPIGTGAGNYAEPKSSGPVPDSTSDLILVQDIADRTGTSITDASAVLKYLRDKGLLTAVPAAFMTQLVAGPTQANFNTLLTNLISAGLMKSS